MMNDPQQKYYISITELGMRKEHVLAVLRKIQGLRDTPENLVAAIPCRISGKISAAVAEKVKKYLENVGATVTLEPDTDSEDETSVSAAPFESPGYTITSFEGESSVHEVVESAPPSKPFSMFDSEQALRPSEEPAKRRQSFSFNAPPERKSFIDDAEIIAPKPVKRPLRRKSRNFGPVIWMALFALLGTGIIWAYFSGRFSRLSEQYQQNSLVGTVGVLEIDNPEQAVVTLQHVIGTRVFEPVALTGTRINLRQGDYYIEAQKDGKKLYLPVYIKGRGHSLKTTIAFPTKPAPRRTAYIPAGWFRMGNKEVGIGHFGFQDERPDIDVYVDGFFLSQYEVTNAEFAEFQAAGGYENDVYWDRLIKAWDSLVTQSPDFGDVYGNDGWTSVKKYIRARFVDTDKRPGPRLWENDTPPYDEGQDKYPVLGISFYEAEAYCAWRTQQTGMIHRLPTEAEWEKAAHGYEGYLFSYGNEYDPAKANMETGTPRNVGSYPPNSYGVYDLTGNVWEWVSDHYQSDCYQRLYDQYKTEIRNPKIFDNAKPYARGVIRGGSFRSVNRVNARVPTRYPMFPNDWHTNIGFRYVVAP